METLSKKKKLIGLMLIIIVVEFILPLFDTYFFPENIDSIKSSGQRPLYTLMFILIYVIQPYFPVVLSNLCFKDSIKKLDIYKRFKIAYIISVFFNFISIFSTSMITQYLTTRSVNINEEEKNFFQMSFELATTFFVMLFDDLLIPVSELIGYFCMVLLIIKSLDLQSWHKTLLTVIAVPTVYTIIAAYLGIFNYELHLFERIGLDLLEKNGDITRFSLYLIIPYLFFFRKEISE